MIYRIFCGSSDNDSGVRVLLSGGGDSGADDRSGGFVVIVVSGS